MKSVIRWAVQNTPAMNTLMVSVLLVGAFSLWTMRREVFPEFELEIIMVSVPYPGASPSEVEEGICQKIEEAVRTIDGIKKQTAIAAEGVGSMVLELNSDVKDVQKVLGEVRSEIDRISTFPERAEDPEVKQITMREAVIHVGVVGPDVESPQAERYLRELAERVREELIGLQPENQNENQEQSKLQRVLAKIRSQFVAPTNISQAEVKAAKNYQIDVEISEDTLREHGLTLAQVSQLIRRNNVELPAGTIKTDSQDVLVKGKDKSLTGEGIADLPVLTQPGGTVLTVGDLATVRDQFDDTTAMTRVNGQPAMVIAVERTSKEDLLAMTAAVRDYVKQKAMPAGYHLMYWGDRSVEVRDRLNLLQRNGLQGLILVFITLAIFLELRLAFWVALGIPVSMLGACILLLMTGQTLNMLSSFAFLMALGIIVDDAIVIGENIYSHRQMGKGFLRAAIEGTTEVLPSVGASVATTIIAFLPLMYVSGVMGKFIAVMPVAIIAMLLISLFESSFILPCHLAHGHHEENREPFRFIESARRFRRNLSPGLRWTLGLFALAGAALLTLLTDPFRYLYRGSRKVNEMATRRLEGFIERSYLPMLGWGLKNPLTIVAGAGVIFLLAIGIVRSGLTPFIVFPKLDGNRVQAAVSYPDGTPSRITQAAVRQLETAALELEKDYVKDGGSPFLELRRWTVGEVEARSGPGRTSATRGGHVGGVTLELAEAGQRDITSSEIVARWRKKVGDLPGVESLTFGNVNMGPAGTPIEFKLLARSGRVDELEAAVEKCKARLAKYPGVFDVSDDSQPGKWEFQIRLKERAKSLGVTLGDVAETVRASYYGDEVMRLQRGRHEVKLMVRYPLEDRHSLADFDQVRVRTSGGTELPLTELADVHVERGYSEINRVDQMRSVTISADINESQGNAQNVVRELQSSFMPKLFEEYPDVRVRWEGQQEQTVESVKSLLIGSVVALVAMFVLLTLQFRSYFQPLLIMAVIPFGIVGAIGGHFVMGLPLTLFSFFGIVALTGVVVNDSIVLIDFINHRVREGIPLEEALLDAGRRRFRPVMLTSITTIAGLLPILLETSLQAQLLIPMATSLCFGLMLTTVLVLILVPTFYLIYFKITGRSFVSDDEDENESRPREVETTPQKPELVMS